MSGVVNYCLDLSHGFQIFGHWLYNWQTLIAAGIASAAALLTGLLIYRQIKQAEGFHRDELGRRHNAARIALPIALASIGDICSAIADNVAHAIEARDNSDIGFSTSFEDAVSGDFAREEFDRVSIPSDIIAAVQRFVETLTDERDIRHVAELISSVQILLSRYKTFNLGQPGVVIYLYGLLLDTAKVQLLNDKIFNYGRFVDDSRFSVIGSISNSEAWDMINGKAHGLIFSRKIPDLFFKEIAERIGRYKANDFSPWNEKFEE